MPSARGTSAIRSPRLFPGQGAARNLVVVRAGRSSLHPGWRNAHDRPQFDLVAARYEPGPSLPASEGTAEIVIPGSKIAGLATLFRHYPDLLDRYDFIALFDDDLRICPGDIERLFRFGDMYGLDLFQPSLSWDSHFSYAAFLQNPGFLLRHTNMVEMMCPVFRASHLRRALPLFDLSFETGIDLVWCRLTDAGPRRYAIIDAVSVCHARPVGSTKDRQGFGKDETYDGQIKAVLDRFGITFRGVVTSEGITRKGRRVTSRLVLAMQSLRLWQAWRVTPMPRRDFIRFLTDYTRHCLFRPVNLARVDLRRGLASAPPGFATSGFATSGSTTPEAGR